MIIPSRRHALVALVAAAALAGGAVVATHYYFGGLTLSHYDARGHLVVARRIFDSITPGWQQIGAVWLPLPHLLNALPVQIDFFYRTGLSAVAISIACFAVAAASIGWIVERLSGSRWAAVAAVAVFGLNPNVLYLQSTPMTELLLIALNVLAIGLLIAWVEDTCADGDESDAHRVTWRPAGGLTPEAENLTSKVQGPRSKVQGPRSKVQGPRSKVQGPQPKVIGIVLALACLTRYEAWPVAVAALSFAGWALGRQGRSLPQAIRRCASIAVYPMLAVAGFFVFSRIVVGHWFADDFFVPENPAQGDLFESISEIGWGVRMLSGDGVLVAALAGVVLLAAFGLRRRDHATALVPLALLGTASVPLLAFYDGHPYRIRYMVPLIAAQAITAGAAAGLLPRRLRTAAAAILLVTAVCELRPLDPAAPMVTEAQWDLPNRAARDTVSRCLAEQYDGTSIMASMGSLGHYMQDLSRSGFDLGDFLHEGNGDIWLAAIVRPQPYAGWMLIEEKAEGGDMLAHIARETPAFLRGYSRVCEAAGVALYRRHTTGSPAPATAARALSN